MAAVLAPHLGLEADATGVRGPADAVGVAALLAEAMAPRIGGRADLRRLAEHVAEVAAEVR